MELDGREIYVPFLQIVTSEEEFVLHYFNSLVRLFPDPYANHVEVREKGKTVQGVRLTTDIVDRFVEYEFPRRYDPFVDEDTLVWLSSVEASHIDDELGSL